MGILDTIRQKGGELTKKQQLVADYMQMHPDEMAYLTLKDLSRKIGVTELTVLNACQGLGYRGLNDVKYEFRKELLLSEKTDVIEETYNDMVPDYVLSDREQFLRAVGKEEIELLRGYWARFDMKTVLDAAGLLFHYKKILICGRGFAFSVAENLQSYLTYADIFAVAVNTELNDNTYGMLAGIDRDTLLVAVSFPDYYFMTLKAAKYAKEAGAKLIVLTDRPDAEIAAYGDLVLTAPTTTLCFLNTLSPVMLLLNILGSALNLMRSEKGDGPNYRGKA